MLRLNVPLKLLGLGLALSPTISMGAYADPAVDTVMTPMVGMPVFQIVLTMAVFCGVLSAAMVIARNMDRMLVVAFGLSAVAVSVVVTSLPWALAAIAGVLAYKYL